MTRRRDYRVTENRQHIKSTMQSRMRKRTSRRVSIDATSLPEYYDGRRSVNIPLAAWNIVTSFIPVMKDVLALRSVCKITSEILLPAHIAPDWRNSALRWCTEPTALNSVEFLIAGASCDTLHVYRIVQMALRMGWCAVLKQVVLEVNDTFLSKLAERIAAPAMLTVCRRGHASMLRLLVQPPWNIARMPATSNHDFNAVIVSVACRYGQVEILNMIGDLMGPFQQPPWASLFPELLHDAFHRACENGQTHILDALARPPWNLTANDARARDNLALKLACQFGQADTIDALGRAPWNLTGDDIRAGENFVFRVACQDGHAVIVERLGRPPWNLGPADARTMENFPLRCALACGHAAVVQLLGEPPFSLGTEDARTNDNIGLREACFNGHVEILDMLGRAPWFLTSADAEAEDNAAMRHACESIQSVAVAQKLTQPPWNLRCC